MYHYIQEDDYFIIPNIENSLIIALDTEFERTRTYFPMISIIQICDDFGNIYILDCLSLSNQYVYDVLKIISEKEVIIHAASQDVQAIYYKYKIVIKNIFDTQIYTKKMFNFEIGYDYMCNEFLGITIEKTYQYSKWLNRPLSKNLLDYAAKDVEFLHVIRQKIIKLCHSDIIESAKIECEKFCLEEFYNFNPLSGWQTFSRKILKNKKQEESEMKELYKKREILAAQRNLPKRFIVSDDKIKDICKMIKDQKDKNTRISKYVRLIDFLKILLLILCFQSEANVGYFSNNKCKKNVLIELNKNNVSRKTISEMQKKFKINKRAVKSKKNQPERTIVFNDYLKKTQNEKSTKEIMDYAAKNKDNFQDLQTNRFIISALLRAETRFGNITGNYNATESLYTMYCQSLTEKNNGRAKFFMQNILALAKLFDKNLLDYNVKSSWAGAIGNMQFMPVNLIKYSNLLKNKNDIFKNYTVIHKIVDSFLVDLGWKNENGYLTEIQSSQDFVPIHDISFEKDYINKINISQLGKRNLFQEYKKAFFIIPDYKNNDNFEKQAYIAFDNYRVIFSWNRSHFFATSVGISYEKILEHLVY